jgi:hypothetical protein
MKFTDDDRQTVTVVVAGAVMHGLVSGAALTWVQSNSAALVVESFKIADLFVAEAEKRLAK